MKKFLEFIGMFSFAFGLIFLDAWCYMVVYNNGIWPLLGSLQICPPALGFGFFLMFSLVVSYVFSGKSNKTIQLNTSEGWTKVITMIVNKLFWVGLIVLFNVILF